MSLTLRYKFLTEKQIADATSARDKLEGIGWNAYKQPFSSASDYGGERHWKRTTTPRFCLELQERVLFMGNLSA